MKPKPQICMIHGGMTFKNKKDYIHYLKTRTISLKKRENWATAYADKKLGHLFEITRPAMPMKENAKYEEWKIHFERHIPLMRDGLTLVGGSLGGIFLAKYLSEHKFPKKITSVFLLCAPFDDTCPSGDLVGGFKLSPNLSLLEKNTKNLHLMFSKDDLDVPVSHALKYRKKLPNADIIIYESKNGHFNISEFPEIVEMIKHDSKKRSK